MRQWWWQRGSYLQCNLRGCACLHACLHGGNGVNPICLSIYLSICLYVYLYLSIYLSTYLHLCMPQLRPWRRESCLRGCACHTHIYRVSECIYINISLSLSLSLSLYTYIYIHIYTLIYGTAAAVAAKPCPVQSRRMSLFARQKWGEPDN